MTPTDLIRAIVVDQADPGRLAVCPTCPGRRNSDVGHDFALDRRDVLAVGRIEPARVKHTNRLLPLQ